MTTPNPPSTLASTAVLLPMQLSAFALTEQCCDSTNYKVGPITQHNYSFLRLHQQVLSSDTLDHVDVHCASPATLNPRVTDLGTGELRQERLGVYVHWTVPQVYRTGYAAANAPSSDSVADNRAQAALKRQAGFPTQQNPDNADFSSPDFRPVPNRWLVVRHLQMDPKYTTIPKSVQVKPFEAWVVESDTITNINYLTDDSVDIENEFAPFVKPSGENLNGSGLIDEQAEVFIGKKTPLTDWQSSIADGSPHVDLSILTSSNPLFADNTHHNMNVFTVVDNFKYKDGQGSDVFLTKAKADYYVIGWHSSPDADPMTTSPPVAGDTAIPSHGNRLSTLNMELKSAVSSLASNWLTSSDPSRMLCHAAMYDVQFDRSALPTQVLAETMGSQFSKNQPIAIGNTPMDALLAYCSAHYKKTGEDLDWQVLENDLLHIQGLLRQSEDEDVDGLRAAQDENFQQAFSKSAGGHRWSYKQQSGPTSQPVTQPTADEINGLTELNAIQSAIDNVLREANSLKWSMFAWWWKVASDVDADMASCRSSFEKLNQQYNTLLEPGGQLSVLTTNLQQAQADIANIENKIQNASLVIDPRNPSSVALSTETYLQKVAEDGFFQRKDPVLMFGQLGRGWDSDFTQSSKVRLQSQTVTSQAVATPGHTLSDWDALSDLLQDVVAKGKDGVTRTPPELQVGIQALLVEFRELRTSQAVKSAIAPNVIPWYHDEIARFPGPPPQDETRGRDCWNSTQPWQPILVEWEAAYYEIPFEKWKFKEFDSRWHWGSKTVNLGVTDSLAGLGSSLSRRHVSGRQFLLPQASSSLTTILQDIFKNTNSNDLTNLYQLPVAERTKLLQAAGDIDIISAPMTGLTSHLLTLYEGTHLNPLVRLVNQPVQPIGAAVKALPYTDGEVATATQIIKRMDIQTSLTPYGSSDIIDGNTNNRGQFPVKQVTHGQLTFTKMNVVDKFGQVISAIGPEPPAFKKPIPSINPCISDAYFPGTVGGINPDSPGAQANTVVAQSDLKACSFIALTPTINQPARINASFVTQTNGAWQMCSDWEDPIWGWLVVNYADNGLQIFLPDGTFYREVRPGGQFKTAATKKFLPFTPPATAIPSQSAVPTWKMAQINKLIAKLATPNDESYLQAFFQMISQSLDDKQAHAPASYATFSSAIIGKPLALVNAGWSLELAGSQNVNWSTSIPGMPPRRLLNEQVNAKANNSLDFPSLDSDPNGASFTPGDDASYTFPVKLGDSERSFDGLVGYWPIVPDHAGQVPVPSPAVKTGSVTGGVTGGGTGGGTGGSSSATVTKSPELDLGTLYTYFTAGYPTSNPPTPGSQTPVPPSLDPRRALTSTPDPETGSILAPLKVTPYHFSSTVQGDHSAKLRIFGLILDPFFPVHAYSAVLPNKALKLPDWIVEQAFKRMTAFWHAGPLLVTQDVSPTLANGDELTADYVSAIAPPTPASVAPGSAASQGPIIALPLAPPAASSSGASAEYRWLQPYWKDVSSENAQPLQPSQPSQPPLTPTPIWETRYRAMGLDGDAAVGADAATLRLEAGPYTAVEGYIQVAKPLA